MKHHLFFYAILGCSSVKLDVSMPCSTVRAVRYYAVATWCTAVKGMDRSPGVASTVDLCLGSKGVVEQLILNRTRLLCQAGVQHCVLKLAQSRYHSASCLLRSNIFRFFPGPISIAETVV